jgi:hypothetical protein
VSGPRYSRLPSGIYNSLPGCKVGLATCRAAGLAEAEARHAPHKGIGGGGTCRAVGLAKAGPAAP